MLFSVVGADSCYPVEIVRDWPEILLERPMVNKPTVLPRGQQSVEIR